MRLFTTGLLFTALFSTQIAWSQIPKNENRIKIVTSLPYIKDLVNNITCYSGEFDVSSIVQLNEDPHSFALSPKSRLSFEGAQIVIYTNNELENWITKIPKKKDQTWLPLSDGLVLQKLNHNHNHSHDHSHDHSHAHSHDHSHDHSHNEKHDESSEFSYDPHIWQSPEIIKQVVEKITLTLQNIEPNSSQKLTKCRDIYLKMLNNEVSKLKESLKNIPQEKRILVTSHDSLGYFAKEFNFKIESILGLSDDSAPTPKQLQNMIRTIKKYNVPAIFLESTGNMRGIETISKETGVKIGGTLYGDSLGDAGSGAETVLGMWKKNVSTIQEAFANITQ